MTDREYLDIALSVIQPNCLRRNYGAVIVKNGEVIATGYTSIPGNVSCNNGIGCERDILHIPSGQGYERCNSVHAEVNACLNAGKDKCKGATLYLAGQDRGTEEEITAIPCSMCIRVIRECGIREIITRDRVIICQ